MPHMLAGNHHPDQRQDCYLCPSRGAAGRMGPCYSASGAQGPRRLQALGGTARCADRSSSTIVPDPGSLVSTSAQSNRDCVQLPADMLVLGEGRTGPANLSVARRLDVFCAPTDT